MATGGQAAATTVNAGNAGANADVNAAAGSAHRNISGSNGSGGSDARHFRLLQQSLRARRTAATGAAGAASAGVAATPARWSDALNDLRQAEPATAAASQAAGTAASSPAVATRGTVRPLADALLLVACRRCQRTVAADAFQHHWAQCEASVPASTSGQSPQRHYSASPLNLGVSPSPESGQQQLQQPTTPLSAAASGAGGAGGSGAQQPKRKRKEMAAAIDEELGGGSGGSSRAHKKNKPGDSSECVLDDICGVPLDSTATTSSEVGVLSVSPSVAPSGVCCQPLSCKLHSAQQKKAVSGRTMSFGYLLNRQNSMLAKKENATVKKRLPHPPTLKRANTGASHAASSRSGSDVDEHSAQNSSDDSDSSGEDDDDGSSWSLHRRRSHPGASSDLLDDDLLHGQRSSALKDRITDPHVYPLHTRSPQYAQAVRRVAMTPSLSYNQRHALATRCWNLATLFHTHDVRSGASTSGVGGGGSSSKGSAFASVLQCRALPPAVTPIGCNPITAMADKLRDLQAAQKLKQSGLAAANGARSGAMSKGAQGGAMNSGGSVGPGGSAPHGAPSNALQPPPPSFGAQANSAMQSLDSKTKMGGTGSVKAARPPKGEPKKRETNKGKGAKLDQSPSLSLPLSGPASNSPQLSNPMLGGMAAAGLSAASGSLPPSAIYSAVGGGVGGGVGGTGHGMSVGVPLSVPPLGVPGSMPLKPVKPKAPSKRAAKAALSSHLTNPLADPSAFPYLLHSFTPQQWDEISKLSAAAAVAGAVTGAETPGTPNTLASFGSAGGGFFHAPLTGGAGGSGGGGGNIHPHGAANSNSLTSPPPVPVHLHPFTPAAPGLSFPLYPSPSPSPASASSLLPPNLQQAQTQQLGGGGGARSIYSQHDYSAPSSDLAGAAASSGGGGGMSGGQRSYGHSSLPHSTPSSGRSGAGGIGSSGSSSHPYGSVSYPSSGGGIPPSPSSATASAQRLGQPPQPRADGFVADAYSQQQQIPSTYAAANNATSQQQQYNGGYHQANR